MKFKDIEKNLKIEQDGAIVPDVYARASQAPLNKLLSGETPARAFQRQLIFRLLIIVLALFLIAAIGLSALWLTPSDNKNVPDCYATVTVERDGKATRLGLIMSGKNIISIVCEMNDGTLNKNPIVSHSSRINDFISPIYGDKVSVSLLSNMSTSLTEATRFIVGELEMIYNSVPFEMTTTTNYTATRERIATYIRVCGGTADSNDTIPSLIQKYAALFN